MAHYYRLNLLFVFQPNAVTYACIAWFFTYWPYKIITTQIAYTAPPPVKSDFEPLSLK